ncbi:MAG: transposase [Oscillospiraceae bacterium]
MQTDFPRRKPNRLNGHDYSRGGAYFITVCTKERQEILWQRRNDDVGGDAHIAPPLSHNMFCDKSTQCVYGQEIHLSDVGETVKRYIQTIPGIKQYVIMPNHLHMIICINGSNGVRGDVGIAPYPNEQSIPQRIKSFKILVTKELGYPIFQRSYHDRIIRSEKEYQAISQYIKNNPAHWEQDSLNLKNQMPMR